MRRANIVVLVAAAVGLAACYRSAWYDGDGQLTDYGWQAVEGNRYKLDLGPVNLATPGIRTYRLHNLPSAEFAVGLEIVESEPIQQNSTRADHPGLVRLELRNSNNEFAILEEGRLNTWVRSHALTDVTSSFLYRRGESRDFAVDANGDTQSERLGTKAEKGWGTYFTARRSSTYVIKFQVIDPRLPMTTAARLILYGD